MQVLKKLDEQWLALLFHIGYGQSLTEPGTPDRLIAEFFERADMSIEVINRKANMVHALAASIEKLFVRCTT